MPASAAYWLALVAGAAAGGLLLGLAIRRAWRDRIERHDED